MKKKMLLLFILIFVVTMVSGCIPGDGSYGQSYKAGFFWGIWHGWIAPVSLILGIFFKNIRVYEVMNTGWFYDLGFYLAIISGFGGLSLSRRRKK